MEQTLSFVDIPGPVDFPNISKEQSFFDIVKSLAKYVSELIVVPYTFENLRVGHGNLLLAPITEHLGENCQQPEIVGALLALKWHYALDPDDRGIMQTRGWACEIIAWRYLSYLSEHDVLDFLLFEVQPRKLRRLRSSNWFRSGSREPTALPSETSSLLGGLPSTNSPPDEDSDDEFDPTARFAGLNALEIAAVAEAKKFLAQRSVQRIIGAIWRGDIIFWPALNVTTTKKPQRYNPRRADPYSRLRVPRYQKLFEALFFASFLALYYAVLLERHPERITPLEFLLYIWIAAFAYDEFGELRDSGSLFYAADVWNLWDAAIVVIALVFLVVRTVGLVQKDPVLLDVSFDILSLEALLLVPRVCSILSVHPYFATLIPGLKEMIKDCLKFFAVVIIIYLGFLTTFAMLARDTFTVRYITWTLVYVFFGSSNLGFDIAVKISPMLGPPLMLIFVTLTNILLLTSLISLLSNSLTKIMDHAREEYFFQYSLFVLEASASRRLTYYLPPLNLIPLILFRPLRPFLHADTLRQLRIITLKMTHWPFVLPIWIYETAPGPRRLLSAILGKDIDDHDESITDNIFAPPRIHHNTTLSRPASAETHFTRGDKQKSKKWHLDLQPRASHRRNFSHGHGQPRINIASISGISNNVDGGDSVLDLRKQQDIHATLRKYDTNDRKSAEASQTRSSTQRESSPVRKHPDDTISPEEFRSLKETISSLEVLVKRLIAEKDEESRLASSSILMTEDEG